jgi:hypothetical protein
MVLSLLSVVYLTYETLRLSDIYNASLKSSSYYSSHCLCSYLASSPTASVQLILVMTKVDGLVDMLNGFQCLRVLGIQILS